MTISVVHGTWITLSAILLNSYLFLLYIIFLVGTFDNVYSEHDIHIKPKFYKLELLGKLVV